jgi:hypothetical protein
MLPRNFVLCSATALLAVAVACSKSPESPASPAGTPPVGVDAAADGSTLKVTAPTPQAPVNGAQPQSLTFVAGASTAQYAVGSTPALSYQLEIKNAAGTTVCTGTGSQAGTTVTITPACTIEFDANHTWRMRAALGAAVGPWSTAATFKSPIGGYINGNELYDPLYNGRTVGTAINTQFIAGRGIELLGHDSRVTYQLPTNLQQGEMSVMATGYDEGSPGDKTKIMSMMEGGGNDITDNDYRMTVEKRGRAYTIPGAVTWRIITGEASDHGRIFDGARIGVEFSDERWYFWKFTWGGGRAALEVREDSPRGRVIYSSSSGIGGNPYRPVPHFIHLGAPVGRAGPIDASIPGAIYKNLWVSSRPRPTFPNE